MADLHGSLIAHNQKTLQSAFFRSVFVSAERDLPLRRILVKLIHLINDS